MLSSVIVVASLVAMATAQCQIADCNQCVATPSCAYCVSQFGSACLTTAQQPNCGTFGGTLINSDNVNDTAATTCRSDPCQQFSGSCGNCLAQSGCVVCRTTSGDACISSGSSSGCSIAGGTVLMQCPTTASPSTSTSTSTTTTTTTAIPTTTTTTTTTNTINTPSPTPTATPKPPTNTPVPPSSTPTPTTTTSTTATSPSTTTTSSLPTTTTTTTTTTATTMSPMQIDILCGSRLGSCPACHSAHPSCIWCNVPGGGACVRAGSSYAQACDSFGTPVAVGQTCPPPNPCTASYSQNCTSCLIDNENKQCGYCKALGSGVCFGAGSNSFIPFLCAQASQGTFLTTTGNLTNCPNSLSFTFAPTPPPSPPTTTTSTTTSTGSSATTTSTAVASTTSTATSASSSSLSSSSAPSSGGESSVAGEDSSTTTRAPVMCTSETISIICKNQCEGQVTFGKCECVDGISNVVCNGEGACTDSTVQEICLSKCGTKINIKTCECKDSLATTKCHDEETIAVVSRAHSLVVVARFAIGVAFSSALLTSL